MKKRIDLLKEAMAEGAHEGMMTFDQSLYNLYRQGRISYENAIAYADSANDLRLKIKMDEVQKKGAQEDSPKKDSDTTFRLRTDMGKP